MRNSLFSLVLMLPLVCQAQKIGLQLYSVRDQIPKDVPGTLAMIKSWGIDELEGGGTYGLSTEEFLKLCKQNKLTMRSIGADFKELETDLPKVIAQAKSFGVKYVVCFWLPHQGDVFTKADADKAIVVFNKAGKELAANGLNLCYHPHGYEFGAEGNGTLFDYMVNAIDKRYANFEMDVYWVKQGGADPVALLNKYPDRFKMLHLKDRKPGTPNTTNGHADVETNVVLGQGDVNIAEIMRVAKKIGIKHYFIEDESSRVVQQVPESVKYLKSLK
jgi:sugar phosphate isomerase/epimerase